MLDSRGGGDNSFGQSQSQSQSQDQSQGQGGGAAPAARSSSTSAVPQAAPANFDNFDDDIPF
jgi:single-stranded DNA-binding protein